MIGRLYATHCGAAHCILAAVPGPRVCPIQEVFRYAELARIIDARCATLEVALFGAGEPTF